MYLKGPSILDIISASIAFTDEEIGGKDGMQKFVDDESFKKLNVGFVLDEGLATEEEAYKVHYGERSAWCRCFYLPAASFRI